MKYTAVFLVVALGAALQAGAGPSIDWTAGVSYTYDAVGNIRQMAGDHHVYDAAGRLVQSDTNGTRRNYEYDGFGNRTKCEQPGTDCQYGHNVLPARNRLTGFTYDGAGNVMDFEGHHYDYDSLSVLTARDAGQSGTIEYVYTADDERIAIYTPSDSSWRWTLRDASAKVVREMWSRNGTSGLLGTSDWTWVRDYVWRSDQLLASRQLEPGATSPSTYHYHVDHLGTPRRITTGADTIVGVHDYHAFGPETADGTNEPAVTPLKFTGHERDVDLAGVSSLDYMHARYYDGALARFLSVDPVMSLEGNLVSPQGWNRYSYAANNPLNSVDPSGAVLISLTGQNTLYDIAGDASPRVSFNSDGTLNVSGLTAEDLVNNEGALLLYEMAGSENVYTYAEGTSANSKGGIVPVTGVVNLDDNPADSVGATGQPIAKTSIHFPPAGVNGAVTVDPSIHWADSGTGLLNVPTRAVAFHELAESYSKVERNVRRGFNEGPGGHKDSQDRERYLMMQRPSWTSFPAGGVLKKVP